MVGLSAIDRLCVFFDSQPEIHSSTWHLIAGPEMFSVGPLLELEGIVPTAS